MSHIFRRRSRSRLKSIFCFSALVALSTVAAQAVTVHGTITDPVGDVIPNAIVTLMHDGHVVQATRSRYDGSYELTTGYSGRFYVLATGKSYRQIATQSFYAGTLANVIKNVTLEPAWVRQQVVVTATGKPTPQAQLSAPVSALGFTDFKNRASLVDALRQLPGLAVVQSGERGAITSVFLHGGNSSANRVVLDGVPIEDVGGAFDFSSLGPTAIDHIEAYRGANSTLYGADAASGVIAFRTPQGSTPFPSLLYEGDAGNFGTYRNQVQLGGMRTHLDYYGAFSDLQTKNSIANDEYHRITSAVNLGYELSANTGLRLIVHHIDRATGLPGTYKFFGLSNTGKESDQDTFLSGTITHSFNSFWSGLVRYGLVRKREQAVQTAPAGNLIPDFEGSDYYGNVVTIRGANGYQATGQALMNYSAANYAVYPNTVDNNNLRDNLYAETTYAASPVLNLTGSFRYEDERASEYSAAYYLHDTLERSNYDYNLAANGQFGHRLFYLANGTVEKNELYGTVGAPSLGLSYYLVKPRAGLFDGTRLVFNFAKGYQEPTMTDQLGSLYDFLWKHGGQASIEKFGVRPMGAQKARTYDGGFEQIFANQHVHLRAEYFHNEFSDQVESVPAQAVPTLLPNLSAAAQQELMAYLNAQGAYSLDLNSQDFSAQGADAVVEYGATANIFVRAGYTYTDAKIQHSFSSDALSPSYNPNFPKVAIGAYGPLVGARPFRRPPHTGFSSITYTGQKWTGVLTGAYASRSDDSTFLLGEDVNGGNTLLLPNRNLDHGYAKLDLAFTYQLRPGLQFYTQLNNLTSDQQIAPIGYTSLPFNFRTGLRIALGKLHK